LSDPQTCAAEPKFKDPPDVTAKADTAFGLA